MNKQFILVGLFLLMFGFGNCQNQTFYYDLRDGVPNFTVWSILDTDDAFLVGVNKENSAQFLKVAPTSQQIGQYSKQNFHSINLSKTAQNYLSFAMKNGEFHADSMKIIEMDSLLQPIREFKPLKTNWPRPYFRNRSFIPAVLDGKVAYFGGFSDSSVGLNDSIPLYGWLILNGDSLTNVNLNTSFSSTRLMYCFPADDGFYSIDPVTAVNFPWAQPVPVTSITKFNDQMQWQKSATFSMPSNLPGFSRLLQSSNTRNLAINEHSIYAMAEYEAASPNFLSITQKSCAIYRFDRELNRIRVVHDLASAGKMTEISAHQQIALDQSGQFIYAVWKECDPYQLFADQTRECATIVLKYDTALNLVWKRVFSVPDMNFHGETMAPTSDGGLLVAGFYIDLPPGPNLRNTFVLKVDSAGNHVVSVPGVSATHNKITAYPNPTSDVLNLSWQSGHYNQLLLRDVQGRLIQQAPLDPQATSTQLDVQSWAPGLYFYQLRSPNGQQLQGKFLKR